MKKLHIKLKDQFGSIIIDNFIDHIDACTSHTLLYETCFQAGKHKINRITESIKSIMITAEGVVIYYVSGYELLITRVRA